MENNFENIVVEEKARGNEANNKQKKFNPIVLWVTCILSVLALIISSIAIFQFSVISKKQNQYYTELQQVREMAQETKKKSDLVFFANEVSEGVVTSKVIVQKALFSEAPLGCLSGVIDLKAQPPYAQYFNGQGKFDLTDRELRIMIEEIMSRLEEYFNAAKIESIKFGGGEIIITQNNYKVVRLSRISVEC